MYTQLPPKNDPFWEFILTNDLKVNLSSFTLKIKLTTLKNQIQRKTISLDKAVENLYQMYTRYILIPSFIEDLKKMHKLYLSMNTAVSTGLYDINQVKDFIEKGKILALAGTEQALSSLPQGKWIAGTIPYFFDKGKGVETDDKIFVHDFTEYAQKISIKIFNTDTLQETFIPTDKNIYRFVIIPPFTDIHKEYSVFAFMNKDVMLTPTIGWIAGKKLNSDEIPMVFNGLTGEKLTDQGVLMEVEIDEQYNSEINIVNIFEIDPNSPTIEFENDGFCAEYCLIDGKKVKLAEFIEKNNIDIRYPLIGDFSGANINISFQEIKDSKVYFYAPFFKGIKYRFSKRGFSYPQKFKFAIKQIDNTSFVFSANCILNYIYGEAEINPIDEKVTGPATFGEIAYLLVNQTFVYLNLIKIK